MIVRCKNGHYFDDRRYKTCPHCGIDFNRFAAEMQGRAADNDKTLAYDAADESKTVAYGEGDDDSVTVSYYSAKMSAEPVAGWLVCVSGDDKGRDFRIKAGRNSIGRANSNDIVLRTDPTVARDNHAEIVYDHVSNKTYLINANSTEVLVNGVVITAPRELHGRETVKLGETLFVFVPFCTGSFSWDSFEDKQQ